MSHFWGFTPREFDEFTIPEWNAFVKFREDWIRASNHKPRRSH